MPLGLHSSAFHPSAVDALASELAQVAELLPLLSAAELETATTFHGWSAIDVGRHVAGVASDVASGQVENLASIEVASRQARERASFTATEIAQEIEARRIDLLRLAETLPRDAWERPAPGGFDGRLVDAVNALTYDIFVHRHDILLSVGRSADAATEVLESCFKHVRHQLSLRGVVDPAPGLSVDDDRATSYVLSASGRRPDDLFVFAGGPID
jgi:uncharacterized protein (TIGR03083 family)